MKHRFFFAAGFACMFASIAAGQQLSVVIQMDPTPSPYLSDWRSKPNTVMLVVSNPTGVNQEVRLDAFIEGDKRGRVAETKLNAPVPPVLIPPGASTLNAVNAQLLTEDAVRFLGPSASEAMRSGRLPEDNFRLCVKLVKYSSPEIALSSQACTRFEIKLIQPPELIAPLNSATVASPPSFQWSTVPIGIGTFAEYEITLIQVDPGMKNMTEAMEAAPPLVRRETKIPVYQYLPSDPPLEKGQKYAWRVRAFDPQNRYTFAHDGKSEVWLFTYQPGTVIKPPVFANKDKEKVAVGKTKLKDMTMDQVKATILMNCTLKGRYLYTFEKSALRVEQRVGLPAFSFGPPDYDRLKPAKHVVVRLVRHHKIIPKPAGASPEVEDKETGKVYSLESKIISSTTTDDEGNFSFNFFNGDSSRLVANHILDTHTEFDSEFRGSVYRYFTVEIVNPRYCSSGSEIVVDPGETEDVLLTSLVRTYNLDVTVLNSDDSSALGLSTVVYASRGSLFTYTPSMPKDEGELEEPPGMTGAMQMSTVQNKEYPTKKFKSNDLGYVISARTTEIAGPRVGHVILTRFVRNSMTDCYFLSARTPLVKEDGNPNDLYYSNSNMTVFVKMVSKYPQDEIDPGYDYSAEVVMNLSYVIPTFPATVKMKPRPPRIYGIVSRSDSKKTIKTFLALQRWSKAGENIPGAYVFSTEEDGVYEFANIDVTPGGDEWHYKMLAYSYGFKPYYWDNITTKKGIQQERNISLDPRVKMQRRVVDEWAKPLAGVKGIIGEGVEHISNSAGIYETAAKSGRQLFHFEKRTQYADKDTMAYVADEDEDITINDPSKWIVMFKAHRRLTVKVVGPSPDFAPVEGAEVILEDKYTGSIGGSTGSSTGEEGADEGGGITAEHAGTKTASKVGQTGKQAVHLWKRKTGADGRVHFVYDSPDSVAHVYVSVPGQPYVAKHVTASGVQEDGRWKILPVFLQAGGIVKGKVYAGEQRSTGDMKPSGPPVARSGKTAKKFPPTDDSDEPPPSNSTIAGARVFVEGYPDLFTYSNENGEYQLIGVPAGQRTIKACKMADSSSNQFIGEQRSISIAPLQTKTINFFLKQYFGMDITKIYGFPIEVEDIDELQGGKIRISGAFVDLPQNSVFRMKNGNERLAFNGVELAPVPASGTPPLSQVSNGAAVPLLQATVTLLAHNKFMMDVIDEGSPGIAPLPGDLTQGQILGFTRVNLASYNLNSNELQLKEVDGEPQKLFLGRMGSSESAPLDMKFGPLTSAGGTFNSNGVPLRIARQTGSDAMIVFLAYDAAFDAKKSFLQNDGMHLRTVIHVTVASCGNSVDSECDVGLDIGEQNIDIDGMSPLDLSQIQAQDIPLQKWKLRAEVFHFDGDYFSFDGSIRAPLVANLTDDADRIGVPFTAMDLRPTGLYGGTFDTDEIDLMGIAKLKFTEPLGLYKDWKSWILASDDPYVPAELGGNTRMEGMAANAKIELETFYLRSDATTDFTPAQEELLSWEVSMFQPNTFQFGYEGQPYLSMVGSLTLINVPDIGPQATRFIYTAGGKFTMDPVTLASPFNAGGVKVTIAHGMLGPTGFVAEGDWGQFHNRIFLEGSFSLNMWFRHRKVGSNTFSTVAEIINPDHQPPQNQSMFGNPTGPDVWSSYGRTQLESDMTWSTNLVGWYKTQELAGKDSMYYVVVGTGGNGSVNTGNGTLKMKGTSGGLGMLYNDGPGTFPKGPAEAPSPPEDDGPFSNFEITMDFEKMAIIASCDVSAEISGGVSFEGGLTTVISFGERIFWSFIAYGKGRVANPPCEGSAVFLAGVNYEVSAEDRQTVIEYSISKQDLPPEFNVLSGFFTQVAVTLPIPGAPNFSIDLGFAGITVECSMGGEARVGLNFSEGTTFFIGVYATAKIQVDAFVIFSAYVLGFEAEAHLLVKVELGAWFTYNNDAGASFDFLGSILGKLDFGGCVIVMGAEVFCGDITLFAIGGEVKGRVGSGEYLDITPTFTFLGMDF